MKNGVGLKSGKCWGDEIPQVGELRENLLNSDIPHHNCPYSVTDIQTRDPNRVRHAPNRSVQGRSVQIISPAIPFGSIVDVCYFTTAKYYS